jgi:hypothetical protein
VGEFRSAVDALVAVHPHELDSAAFGERIVGLACQLDRLQAYHQMVPAHDRRKSLGRRRAQAQGRQSRSCSSCSSCSSWR